MISNDCMIAFSFSVSLYLLSVHRMKIKQRFAFLLFLFMVIVSPGVDEKAEYWLNVKGTQFLVIESSLKVMKNAFHFVLSFFRSDDNLIFVLIFL